MPVVFGVSRERRGVPPRWCSPDSFPEMLLPPRAFRALHLAARRWDRGTLAGHGARGADLLGTTALVLRHFVCCGQARAAQPGPHLEVPCPSSPPHCSRLCSQGVCSMQGEPCGRLQGSSQGSVPANTVLFLLPSASGAQKETREVDCTVRSPQQVKFRRPEYLQLSLKSRLGN